jgi:hypothetical protein
MRYSAMTDENESPDYAIRVRQRGGSGRNAIWQWEVYASGNALPVEKGIYNGAEAKAYQAARAAVTRLRERRDAKAEGQ